MSLREPILLFSFICNRIIPLYQVKPTDCLMKRVSLNPCSSHLPEADITAGSLHRTNLQSVACDGDRHTCATLAMHVDASPHRRSPLSSHLSPWADLHSVVAYCIRPPGTLGVVHVHFCRVILHYQVKFYQLPQEEFCCYTTIKLATPGPTSIVHHYAQGLSPKAWLTFELFIVHWHNPIVPFVWSDMLQESSYQESCNEQNFAKGVHPMTNVRSCMNSIGAHQSHNPVVC